MTSKRNLKKRLERLEAQQEMKRTAKERFDEAVVDAIIEFATHRFSGTSDAVPADIVASLPAAFQEQYDAPTAMEGTSGRSIPTSSQFYVLPSQRRP